jgi:hypothetical protein
MSTRRRRKGTVTNFEHPDWDPLIGVGGRELLDYFMWMHEVRLRDRTAIHAYKDITTRRYVHLTHEGAAWVYLGDEWYRQVDGAWVFTGIYGDLAEFEPRHEHELQMRAIWGVVERYERLAEAAAGT